MSFPNFGFEMPETHSPQERVLVEFNEEELDYLKKKISSLTHSAEQQILKLGRNASEAIGPSQDYTEAESQKLTEELRSLRGIANKLHKEKGTSDDKAILH